jgi:hypothetical protein
MENREEFRKQYEERNKDKSFVPDPTALAQNWDARGLFSGDLPDEELHVLPTKYRLVKIKAIEDMAKIAWNKNADRNNQWENLGKDEKDEFLKKFREFKKLGGNSNDKLFRI